MCNHFIGLGGPPCSRHLLNIRCGAKGGACYRWCNTFSIHCLTSFLFSNYHAARALLAQRRTALSMLNLAHLVHGNLFARHAPDVLLIYIYINTYIHMYMYVPGLRYLGLGTQGGWRRRAALEFGVIWLPGLRYLGLNT